MPRLKNFLVLGACVPFACRQAAERPADTAGGTAVAQTTAGVASGAFDSGGDTDHANHEATSLSGGGGNTSGGVKFDIGVDSASGGTADTSSTRQCSVVDDMNAVGSCDAHALPDSFEPDIQWAWAGQEPYTQSIVIPLVANLTDDDGDGEIDLCDVPDVVVSAFAEYGRYEGYLFALDGETGTVHWQSDTAIDASITPALGDIDGDFLPEIIAVEFAGNRVMAFEHDGTAKWVGPVWSSNDFAALMIANLDAAGAPEIVAGNMVIDAAGAVMTTLPDSPGTLGFGSAPTAADLDNDGELEIVFGRSAYNLNGTEVYRHDELYAGYPQVANLDEDPEPEILFENGDGISLLNHDGTIRFSNLRPTGETPSSNTWDRPATVHDFDGDGRSEFACSSGRFYCVYERTGATRWRADVVDSTGVAAGTAFDFLGDGIAEAMYADETQFFIYDGGGNPLLTVPRSSGTLIEYPVVADIDNDGSAEILVVSNVGVPGVQTAATIQAIRDVEDRWIQARRIWNQHTYHVTNVREDGTIPVVEPRSWELLNTFRTNAQIENGGVCAPTPAG